MRKLCIVVGAAIAAFGFSACTAPSDTFIEPSLVEECMLEGEQPQQVRMVTYNIHHGSQEGLDAIAEQLELINPDIVALQEVDRFTDRTEQPDQDQAAILAERLGMHHVFAGAHAQDDGDYGIALLSHFPFHSVKRVDLPGGAAAFQPRVAIDAKVCAGSVPIRVVSTHADVMPWVADKQMEFIAEQVKPDLGKGVIVAGDMNLEPSAQGILSLLSAGLFDPGPADGTSSIEGRRIDYIFLDERLPALDARIVPSTASDHVPVQADLKLAP